MGVGWRPEMTEVQTPKYQCFHQTASKHHIKYSQLAKEQIPCALIKERQQQKKHIPTDKSVFQKHFEKTKTEFHGPKPPVFTHIHHWQSI